MNRCLRINDVEPGKFRLGLYLPDVVCDERLYVKPDALKLELVPEKREEMVGVCTEPIPVGELGMYYVYKITSLDSDRFSDLAHKLFWLNPGIDFKGLQAMTTYVHNRFIKDTKGNITKRALLIELIEHSKVLVWDENIINRNKITFFNKVSFIPAGDKRKISNTARRAYVGKLLGEVIHNSALLAIEQEHPQLKVTNKRVLDTVNSSKVNSINTMMKHMARKTVNVLEEHNQYKYFRTEKSLRKYIQFEDLQGKGEVLSNREVSKLLGISLSTVTDFKGIFADSEKDLVWEDDEI